MTKEKFEFSYELFGHIGELPEQDAKLLYEAQQVTRLAYAPYSHFYVGAAALLANGQVLTGTNQENASYPVGICAERVLLGTAATQHPGVPIRAIAISYNGQDVQSNHPISPCGMCRQSLLEFESRVQEPIRLIMGGMEGKIIVVESARMLLPFAFTNNELK